MKGFAVGTTASLALALSLATGAAHAACTTTIGVVMELTGPAGEYGQKASKSVELALRDINSAGGVNGCTLEADIRDAQSQGNVAADVAKQLVEIKKVPVIIGGIISSVSMPILTSVTAPSGVVQMSSIISAEARMISVLPPPMSATATSLPSRWKLRATL